jgi:putative ABC transport system permease protein
MIFKMAWRNIWRNRRRTLITAASILFAVFFAACMEALQKGAWNHMISNVVNFYFGYAQVHSNGYWDEQTIDKAFAWNEETQAIADIPEVDAVLPRIESFALASTGDATLGVLVVGIAPEVENSMTNLKSRLQQGDYLAAADKALLVAEGVTDNLNLGVGDTMVLISQGYRGVNAAGKYPIKGIVKFGSPELNKQMVYLPLSEAQWFYGAEGLITTMALKIDDQDDIEPAVQAVAAQLDTTVYEVMDWEELIPDLVEAKALDSAGNYIVYFILYLIIAFGIFGTILMMTKEREYEFGVLLSIGMKRWQLAWSVWLEILMLAIVGVIAGVMVSVPVIWYFNVNPIRFQGEYAGTLEKFGFEPVFPASFEPGVFLLQAAVVLIITSILALYPMYKLRRMEPVEAMRS